MSSQSIPAPLWDEDRGHYLKGHFTGGRFKREGTYVYLWLIYAAVWQKPTQCCKAITLQLKINLKKKGYPPTPPVSPCPRLGTEYKAGALGAGDTGAFYLIPEEGLGARPTVLIVDELEEEKVEEGDEGGHAEPEEEGQPRVLLGHVLVVGQDGLEVQRVPQILEVREVGGDVEQRRDGLRHHD